MASSPTDKQRIRQKAKSLRFDLVRGWVLLYVPVELRSSLFSIPVPSHERSFNVSSYPLLRPYSIRTIPTAPCSLRPCFLQYYLQQHVGDSCLFAYTPWLIILSYESSLWIRCISHFLFRPTSREYILCQSQAPPSPQSLRFDLVRGSVLSSFPIIPSRIKVLSSPYTCSFSATLIQQREAIGDEEDRHCVERE